MIIDTTFSAAVLLLTLVSTGYFMFYTKVMMPNMNRHALRASYLNGFMQIIFAVAMAVMVYVFAKNGMSRSAGSLVALVVVSLVNMHYFNRALRRAYNLSLR